MKDMVQDARGEMKYASDSANGLRPQSAGTPQDRHCAKTLDMDTGDVPTQNNNLLPSEPYRVATFLGGRTLHEEERKEVNAHPRRQPQPDIGSRHHDGNVVSILSLSVLATATSLPTSETLCPQPPHPGAWPPAAQRVGRLTKRGVTGSPSEEEDVSLGPLQVRPRAIHNGRRLTDGLVVVEKEAEERGYHGQEQPGQDDVLALRERPDVAQEQEEHQGAQRPRGSGH